MVHAAYGDALQDAGGADSRGARAEDVIDAAAIGVGGTGAAAEVGVVAEEGGVGFAVALRVVGEGAGVGDWGGVEVEVAGEERAAIGGGAVEERLDVAPAACGAVGGRVDADEGGF